MSPSSSDSEGHLPGSTWIILRIITRYGLCLDVYSKACESSQVDCQSISLWGLIEGSPAHSGSREAPLSLSPAHMLVLHRIPFLILRGLFLFCAQSQNILHVLLGLLRYLRVVGQSFLNKQWLSCCQNSGCINTHGYTVIPDIGKVLFISSPYLVKSSHLIPRSIFLLFFFKELRNLVLFIFLVIMEKKQL